MSKKILIILVSLIFIQSCSWITGFYVLNKSNGPILIVYKHPKRSETTPYLEKLKKENPERYERIKKPACPLEMEIANKRLPMICNEELEDCRVLNPDEYHLIKKNVP